VDEVAPEESASKGRVDYAFKVRGVSRFYLETKHLKADLDNTEYIKQAVTYAYNKGVTWAGLTSFDRLRLFNAQSGQPFLNLTCQDYADDFDRLWLLSRESIEAGNLDKEARKVGVLPPPQPVERRLFSQLRNWREELFTQLHHYNKDLNFSQIDEVIQRIFNRLIFIRTCEDRGIEEKTLLAAVNQWKSGGHKPELIERLRGVFLQFDGYYDSDLFAQHTADKIFVEASTLENIIGGLYEVPGGVASYDFSVMDADVLGAVYEQYLGHVATVAKRRVKEGQGQFDLGLDVSLEAKKEKRKEQGIYYTPKWVTDYIVKHTVGRFLAEHNHDENMKIKVVDPACGSGSFLIRAYDELLNYHAAASGKPVSGLDQWDRLPVLNRNIFGVDFDGQAIEIARLNLLLRSLARREILPSLADNIRRGNSLISGAETELEKYFGKSWNEKRPFDWQHEFAPAVQGGDFDVVIGNPPYVRIQTLPRDEADYYRDHFASASGSFDIYVLFLEKGIELLKRGGRLGFICSSKFLKSQYGAGILQLIKQSCTVENIVDLSSQTVFAEATTYPAIVVLKKESSNAPLYYVSVPQGVTDSPVTSALDLEGLPAVSTAQEAITRRMWPPLAKGDTLWEKLTANTEPLGKMADKIFVGLQTSADKVYILEKQGETGPGLVRVRSQLTGKVYELENELLKPLLSGHDIKRYGVPVPQRLLLFPYYVNEGKANLISDEDFSDSFPKCWEYLLLNRRTLEDREGGKMRGDKWYAFGRTQNLALHVLPKLAIPRLVKHLEAVYDEAGSFYLDNVDVGGVILKDGSRENYLYLLGLLHSQVLDFCFRRISAPFRGGFCSANRQFIEPLPIRRIDPSSAADLKLRDDLVALVEQMLVFQKKLQETQPESTDERHELERQIRWTDEKIDNQVYDLYGLGKAERKMIGDLTGGLYE
jgi:type I restriction-modification system DNA methylase subunit